MFSGSVWENLRPRAQRCFVLEALRVLAVLCLWRVMSYVLWVTRGAAPPCFLCGHPSPLVEDLPPPWVPLEPLLPFSWLSMEVSLSFLFCPSDLSVPLACLSWLQCRPAWTALLCVWLEWTIIIQKRSVLQGRPPARRLQRAGFVTTFAPIIVSASSAPSVRCRGRQNSGNRAGPWARVPDLSAFSLSICCCCCFLIWRIQDFSLCLLGGTGMSVPS